ncbi:MAG TPA: COR domain-containing protein [Nitrosomonas sp.]|nr:COR domain-containing protein [Nitrosomonas sp.]
MILDLSYNGIGNEGARYLSWINNLTELGLKGNNIDNKGAFYLADLNKLTILDLANNQIKDIGVEYLSKLSCLNMLYLSSNQIRDSGVEHLSNLKHLEVLQLDDCMIGSIGVKHISSLSNLIELDLANNLITDAGVKHIKSLSQLIKLNLSNNEISKAGTKQLVALEKLEFLELKRTAITSLNEFTNFPHLRRLNVSDTLVADLTPIRYLLEKGITAKITDDWKGGILVENCPLIHPPPEIVKQGHEAVLNYFREIDAQGTAALLEAKVLIVGEGRSGKTSLLRRLYQPDKLLPTEDETTRGIDICPYDFRLGDGRTFRLNVWDFGGQQIYHATHQFFLTKNSLYILLDDTAKDAKSVTDESFRYWLEVIDLLSKHSPVLIFQNEKGGRSKSIDIAGIKGRFDNVKEVYNGNLETPESVAKLAQAIEYQVQQLQHVGEQVPAKWVDIRQALEQVAERTPYITQRDYFDLYAQYLEFNRDKALLLSQYLHDLGVFLHFQDDDVLCKSVILQNRWATEAVFRVIDDEIVKSRLGRFTLADCERIWSNSDFRDMHPELRALMEKFELCYALLDLPKSDKTWLMPQLLPPSMLGDLAGWEKPGDLVLTYHYHFLPKGLINRLMVRKHRYVERPELAWANGVLFEADGSSVLVQATSRGNEIVLRARGPEAKTLLSIIAADLDALNASFSGLEERLQKLIPCNCDQCVAAPTPEMYEYKYLLKRKQDGRFNIECRASYQDVNIVSLLDGFVPVAMPAELQKRIDGTSTSQLETKIIKIFLASSEELRKDRDDFDLYFRQQNDRLRKKGIYLEIIRWENFLDSMSETRLQDKYNQEVRNCDIFVSLFMTKIGRYTEEEFDVAHQTFKQNGKPRIYTYFKNASILIGNIDKAAMKPLWKFQDKLKELEHFGTLYDNIEHLKRHFSDQLDKLNYDSED